MKIIGLDSGSTTTKGVLMANDTVLEKYLVQTAGNPKLAMETILKKLGWESGIPIVTTGYGRHLIDSDKSLTEITCHARGAKFLNGNVHCIIDIGGQDSKTIKLSDLGVIEEFNMNDKCAAGTGRFVEVLMHILGEDITELDKLVFDAEPININSMCTVFAETEVVSLVAKGERKQDIALGVLYSICRRVTNQFARVSPKKNNVVFFSGGLSNSERIKDILKECTGQEVVTHELSQFTGAIGAAICYQK